MPAVADAESWTEPLEFSSPCEKASPVLRAGGEWSPVTGALLDLDCVSAFPPGAPLAPATKSTDVGCGKSIASELSEKEEVEETAKDCFVVGLNGKDCVQQEEPKGLSEAECPVPPVKESSDMLRGLGSHENLLRSASAAKRSGLPVSDDPHIILVLDDGNETPIRSSDSSDSGTRKAPEKAPEKNRGDAGNSSSARESEYFVDETCLLLRGADGGEGEEGGKGTKLPVPSGHCAGDPNPLTSGIVFHRVLWVMIFSSMLIGFSSFCFKSIYAPKEMRGVAEHGPAYEFTEYLQQLYFVIPCVVLFVTTVIFAFLTRTIPWLHWLKDNKWIHLAEFLGITIPLIVEALPLLAFALDVIFSTGLSGIDVHVLQAFAIFGSALLGHRRDATFLLLLFCSAQSIEDSAKSNAVMAVDALDAASPKQAWVFSPSFASNLAAVPSLMPSDNQYSQLFPSAGAGINFTNFTELSSLPSAVWQVADVKNVDSGSIVRVLDGELVPLKSTVLRGNRLAHITQAHLDGETAASKIYHGQSLAAGTVLVDGGPLYLQVTHTESQGELAELKAILTAAGEGKDPIESSFETFEKVYSKIMILIFLALLFGLPHLPGDWAVPMAGPKGSSFRALAFLVAGAPCALVLSTPIAYWSTYSVLVQRQVSIAEFSVINQLATITDMVFDKTGTLTTNLVVSNAFHVDPEKYSGNNAETLGSPESFKSFKSWKSRTHFIPSPSEELKDERILRTAAAAYLLEHEIPRQPHAVASAKWAERVLQTQKVRLVPKKNSNYTEHQGKNSSASWWEYQAVRLGSLQKDESHRGIQAEIEIQGEKYLALIGSVNFIMGELNIDKQSFMNTVAKSQDMMTRRGISLIALRRHEPNEVELHALIYDEKIRNGAKKCIDGLRGLGIKVHILSGDQLPRVGAIGKALGIEESNVHGSVTPKRKLEFIQEMQRQGKRVSMVGDETNDAAAMRASTVGIAIGDVASPVVRSTDVALVVLRENTAKHDQGDLSRIPFIVDQSVRCRNVIVQNLAIALLGLLLVAPLAVMAKIPFWAAVVGHEGGSVFVALNSLRLLRVTPL